MAGEKDRLLITIRPVNPEVHLKPQQKTLWLDGDVWDIEWSTVKEIPMTVDFFNVTIGFVVKNPDSNAPKKIEEVWRITRIPGQSRKMRYGINVPESTSTQAKPLENGIYVIKVNAMTGISSGLNVESGVGVALVTINKEADWAREIFASKSDSDQKAKEDAAKKKLTPVDSVKGARITNETVLQIFKALEEEEKKQ